MTLYDQKHLKNLINPVCYWFILAFTIISLQYSVGLDNTLSVCMNPKCAYAILKFNFFFDVTKQRYNEHPFTKNRSGLVKFSSSTTMVKGCFHISFCFFYHTSKGMFSNMRNCNTKKKKHPSLSIDLLFFTYAFNPEDSHKFLTIRYDLSIAVIPLWYTCQ